MAEIQNSVLKLKQLTEELFNDYTTWIKDKPGRATDIETSVKVFSYFLHGRCNKNTSILPELLYCASNLLSFWHDTLFKDEAERLLSLRPNSTSSSSSSDDHRRNNLDINAAFASFGLRRHNNNGGLSNGTISGVQGRVLVEEEVEGDSPRAQVSSASTGAATTPQPETATASSRRRINVTILKRIKMALTLLEYFEVFLEVGAKHLLGDPGRWLVILIVQAVKAGLRLTLLLKFKIGLIESPAIQPFDRKKHFVDTATGEMNPNIIFVLKHSGRIVRKVNASPALSTRTWKLPAVPQLTVIENDLPPLRLWAEILHILRPLCHLTGLGVWGTQSWKPWLTSLTIDVVSLQLHGKPIKMRNSEKIELTRRTYALLYYLIRSPFYDHFTKQKLLTTLVKFSNRIPIVGNLCGMLAEAIPEWQQTYSYTWNDC